MWLCKEVSEQANSLTRTDTDVRANKNVTPPLLIDRAEFIDRLLYGGAILRDRATSSFLGTRPQVT